MITLYWKWIDRCYIILRFKFQIVEQTWFSCKKCCSNKLLFIFTLNWFQYFNINPAKNKSKIHTDKIAWLSTLRLLHKQATYLGLLHVGSYVWYVTVIMSDNRSFFLSLCLIQFLFEKVVSTFYFQFDTLITSHMKCMRWEVTKSKSKVSMRCPFYSLLLRLFVPSIS